MNLEEKVNYLYETQKNAKNVTKIHPVLFVVIVIIFFATMRSWTHVINGFLIWLNNGQPLHLITYAVLATVVTMSLILLTKESDFSLHLLGKTY